MSEDEIGERVAVVETQVRTIADRLDDLTPIAQEWPRAMALLESTHQQAVRTNGKVRRQEKLEIERQARDDERRKLAERASRQQDQRAQRRAWLPPAGASVACVALGWALSHFLH